MNRLISHCIYSTLVLLMMIATAGAQTADSLFQEALRLDKEGFLEEAAETWEKLLAAHPGKELESITRLRLSSTYLKIAQPFKAVEVVKALTISQPQNFDAQFHLANALAKIKSFPEAAASFQKAVELRPGEGLGYVGLALCLFGDRNPGAATEQLQEAKKIFKQKKNISWYRDARIMVHQIDSFEKYPPSFSDLWLENNLDLVRNTYEKTVFNLDEWKN